MRMLDREEPHRRRRIAAATELGSGGVNGDSGRLGFERGRAGRARELEGEGEQPVRIRMRRTRIVDACNEDQRRRRGDARHRTEQGKEKGG